MTDDLINTPRDEQSIRATEADLAWLQEHAPIAQRLEAEARRLLASDEENRDEGGDDEQS